MIYEKPEISFQKFHIDAFLDLDPLSANGPEHGGEIWGGDDDDGGDIIIVGPTRRTNGRVVASDDPVGSWFNG